METRRIRLREVAQEDFPTLFIWRNTEKFRFLFHYNEETIDYAGFCKEFTRDATVRKFQYVIEKTDRNELIGLTFIHSFSLAENHCFMNVFFDEQSEGKGYGVDVFVLFSRFLFESIGIKTLYLEAFAYNTFSIACIRRTGMIEVARLPNKKLHLGKEYDVLRFAGENTLLPEILRMEKKLSSAKAPQ